MPYVVYAVFNSVLAIRQVLPEEVELWEMLTYMQGYLLLRVTLRRVGTNIIINNY